MQFKIDENLPIEIADILSGGGHDAKTVYDERLAGIQDAGLRDVCVKESRVLVSLDVDFSDIRAYPPAELPGVIVLRVGNQSKKHVLGMFRQIIRCLSANPFHNISGSSRKAGCASAGRMLNHSCVRCI